MPLNCLRWANPLERQHDPSPTAHASPPPPKHTDTHTHCVHETILFRRSFHLPRAFEFFSRNLTAYLERKPSIYTDGQRSLRNTSGAITRDSTELLLLSPRAVRPFLHGDLSLSCFVCLGDLLLTLWKPTLPLFDGELADTHTQNS